MLVLLLRSSEALMAVRVIWGSMVSVEDSWVVGSWEKDICIGLWVGDMD